MERGWSYHGDNIKKGQKKKKQNKRGEGRGWEAIQAFQHHPVFYRPYKWVDDYG